MPLKTQNPLISEDTEFPPICAITWSHTKQYTNHRRMAVAMRTVSQRVQIPGPAQPSAFSTHPGSLRALGMALAATPQCLGPQCFMVAAAVRLGCSLDVAGSGTEMPCPMFKLIIVKSRPSWGTFLARDTGAMGRYPQGSRQGAPRASWLTMGASALFGRHGTKPALGAELAVQKRLL